MTDFENIQTIHPSVAQKNISEAERYHNNERQFSDNFENKAEYKHFDNMDGNMWTEYRYDKEKLDKWDKDFSFYLQDVRGFSPVKEIYEGEPFTPDYVVKTEGDEMIRQLADSFGAPAQILELAGPGGVPRSMEHGKSLAVSLGDGRPSEVKESDLKSGLGFVEVDLLTEEGHGEDSELGGWRDIDEWMETNDVEGFDIIVSNPIGGWNGLPKDLSLNRELLTRVTGKLNPGGVLLLKTPPNWDSDTTKKVTERYLAQGEESEFKVFAKNNSLVVERNKKN